MIRAGYDLLGLQTYFTVGPKEARAWTIRRGTPARRAAGVIHSDIERGFIRAEIAAHAVAVVIKNFGHASHIRRRRVARRQALDQPDGHERSHVRMVENVVQRGGQVLLARPAPAYDLFGVDRETYVRTRILALIEHLASIQAE